MSEKHYLRKIKRQKQVVARWLFAVILSLTVVLGMIACAFIAGLYYDNGAAFLGCLMTGVYMLVFLGMSISEYLESRRELENLVYEYEDWLEYSGKK